MSRKVIVRIREIILTNNSARIRVGTIDSHHLDLLCGGFLAHCLRRRYFFVEPAHFLGTISASSDHQFARGAIEKSLYRTYPCVAARFIARIKEFHR